MLPWLVFLFPCLVTILVTVIAFRSSRTDHWKNWTPLEKATLWAQMLVPISLTFTLAFAYLGWQETRKSRENEQLFYESVNRPVVTISSPTIVHHVGVGDADELAVQLQNTGNSTALNFRLQLYRIGDTEPFVDSAHDSPSFWANYQLLKGEKDAQVICLLSILAKKFAFEPSRIAQYDYLHEDRTVKDGVIMTLSYRSLTGELYTTEKVAMLYKPKKPTQILTLHRRPLRASHVLDPVINPFADPAVPLRSTIAHPPAELRNPVEPPLPSLRSHL